MSDSLPYEVNEWPLYYSSGLGCPSGRKKVGVVQFKEKESKKNNLETKIDGSGMIQTFNPRLRRYVKVNTKTAMITVKKSEGPYKNILIV